MGNVQTRLRGSSFRERSKYVLEIKEKEIICSKWPTLMQKRPELFTVTWLAASKKNDRIKELFGLKQDEDPKSNDKFVRLTVSVEEFFDYLIAVNLNDEILREKCQNLGAKHYEMSQNSETDSWEIFMDCLVENMDKSTKYLHGRERAEFLRAWRKLVHYIVIQMRIGVSQQHYDILCKRKKK